MRRPLLRTLAAAAAIAVLTAGGFQVAAAVGAAGADRPDTRAGAQSAAAAPTGTWLRETLGSATDQDWYRYTIKTPGRALVTLGHLPANYALALYDAAGHKVAGSDRSGLQFEQLYPSLQAGDYYVKVFTTTAADPRVAYALQLRTLPEKVIIAEQKNVHDSAGFDIKGEVLNNTSEWQQVLRLHVTWFDKSGNRVGTSNEGIRPGPVAPRQRAEFTIKRQGTNLPAGAASYSIRVDAQTTTARTPTGLVMTPGAEGVQGSARTYRGTLTNHTGQTLYNVYPTVIEYDPLGRANAFGFDHIASLAPGATVSYAMIAGNKSVPAPNAVAFYASILGK